MNLGQVEATEFLLKNGANINCRERDGYYPIHGVSFGNYENQMHLSFFECSVLRLTRFICLIGNAKIIEILLKYGADVNSKSDSGDTPLHIAAQDGHTKIVEILLKSGADVNSLDSRDQTPLHFAGYNGSSNHIPSTFHPMTKKLFLIFFFFLDQVMRKSLKFF